MLSSTYTASLHHNTSSYHHCGHLQYHPWQSVGILIMTKPKAKTLCPPPPKALPPTNVNSFLFDRWMTATHPTKCLVLGGIGKILRFEDYYFESMCVLCTQAFSVADVSTTVNDCESPPGSTELNNQTGHNSKMLVDQYRDFTQLVLGLNNDTWAKHHTESALHNMILWNLDVM
jgi:hypothetical protein